MVMLHGTPTGWSFTFPKPKGAEERALIFVPQQKSYLINVKRGTRQQLASASAAHGGQNLGGRAVRTQGSLAEGFRYVWTRPDIKAILLMLFLISTFGLNFPIFISTMCVTVLHAGAGQYGLLTSIMAVGTVLGALLSARRVKPRTGLLFASAAVFGHGCALAAIMPNFWLFGLALIVIGVSAQTFSTTANSTVQLTTEPVMRGRVMAIFLATALGGTPIGAPFVGWVADAFGPRWALGVGAAAGFAAAIVGIHYLTKYRQLRVRIDAGRVRFSFDGH